MRSSIFVVSMLCFTAVTVDTCLFSQNLTHIPAFPGAEGFGSKTPGGRGGKVIQVTNLDEQGPGSFREACESSGPRIVVFRTGGTIKLRRSVKIQDPYITIAGQTAPGDGICLAGAGIHISTHDVIIRGLRIRIGDDPRGPNPGSRDGISIVNRDSPTRDIIIDHCSVSWAIDENFSVFKNCSNITFQWCISSEGLRNSLHPEGQHSCGMKVGPNVTGVSIHHNLIAHNYRRNPKIARDHTSNGEVINNIVYNWSSRGTDILANVNVVANVYKTGPDWNGYNKGITIKDLPMTLAYITENIGPGRSSNLGDDWLAVTGLETHRSKTPVIPLSNVHIDPVTEVFELVLSKAGAIVPHRDAVDVRIVRSVREGGGRLIDSQSEVGGWPLLDPGKPLQDTDHDGMPDKWEIVHRLNPRDPSDAIEDKDADGYTNVEEYINSLILD